MSEALERHYRVLRRPHVTEKALKLVDHGRAYSFDVAEDANKIEIRKAIEAIFNVKVESVRTMRMLGKYRRLGRHWGRQPSWKKAIVKLHAGYAIEDFY